jgi:hypothetical protein
MIGLMRMNSSSSTTRQFVLTAQNSTIQFRSQVSPARLIELSSSSLTRGVVSFWSCNVSVDADLSGSGWNSSTVANYGTVTFLQAENSADLVSSFADGSLSLKANRNSGSVVMWRLTGFNNTTPNLTVSNSQLRGLSNAASFLTSGERVTGANVNVATSGFDLGYSLAVTLIDVTGQKDSTLSFRQSTVQFSGLGNATAGYTPLATLVSAGSSDTALSSTNVSISMSNMIVTGSAHAVLVGSNQTNASFVRLSVVDSEFRNVSEMGLLLGGNWTTSTISMSNSILTCDATAAGAGGEPWDCGVLRIGGSDRVTFLRGGSLSRSTNNVYLVQNTSIRLPSNARLKRIATVVHVGVGGQSTGDQISINSAGAELRYQSTRVPRILANETSSVHVEGSFTQGRISISDSAPRFVPDSLPSFSWDAASNHVYWLSSSTSTSGSVGPLANGISQSSIDIALTGTASFTGTAANRYALVDQPQGCAGCNLTLRGPGARGGTLTLWSPICHVVRARLGASNILISGFPDLLLNAYHPLQPANWSNASLLSLAQTDATARAPVLNATILDVNLRVNTTNAPTSNAYLFESRDDLLTNTALYLPADLRLNINRVGFTTITAPIPAPEGSMVHGEAETVRFVPGITKPTIVSLNAVNVTLQSNRSSSLISVVGVVSNLSVSVTKSTIDVGCMFNASRNWINVSADISNSSVTTSSGLFIDVVRVPNSSQPPLFWKDVVLKLTNVQALQRPDRGGTITTSMLGTTAGNMGSVRWVAGNVVPFTAVVTNASFLGYQRFLPASTVGVTPEINLTCVRWNGPLVKKTSQVSAPGSVVTVVPAPYCVTKITRTQSESPTQSGSMSGTFTLTEFSSSLSISKKPPTRTKSRRMTITLSKPTPSLSEELSSGTETMPTLTLSPSRTKLPPPPTPAPTQPPPTPRPCEDPSFTSINASFAIVPSSVTEHDIVNGTTVLLVPLIGVPTWLASRGTLQTGDGSLVFSIASTDLVPDPSGFSYGLPGGRLERYVLAWETAAPRTASPPNASVNQSTTNSTFNVTTPVPMLIRWGWKLKLDPLPQYDISTSETLGIGAASSVLPYRCDGRSWANSGLPMAQLRVTPILSKATVAVQATVTAVTSTAVIASGAIGVAGAIDSQSLALLSLFACASPSERKSNSAFRLVAPAALNDSDFGVLAGNLILLSGLLLLHFTLVLIYRIAKKSTWLEAIDFARFPALSLTLCLLLFQGTAFVSFRLLFQPKPAEADDAGARTLGAFGFLTVVGIVVFFVWIVRTKLEGGYHQFVWSWKEHGQHRAMLRWLFPEGRWEPREIRIRYGLHTGYKINSKAVVYWPFVLPVIFVLCGFYRPSSLSGCRTQMILLAFAVFVAMLWMCMVRPFRGRLPNAFAVLSLWCIGVIVSCSARLTVIPTDATATWIIEVLGPAQSLITVVRVFYGIGVRIGELRIRGYDLDLRFEWYPQPFLCCGSQSIRKRKRDDADERTTAMEVPMLVVEPQDRETELLGAEKSIFPSSFFENGADPSFATADNGLLRSAIIQHRLQVINANTGEAGQTAAPAPMVYVPPPERYLEPEPEETPLEKLAVNDDRGGNIAEVAYTESEPTTPLAEVTELRGEPPTYSATLTRKAFRKGTAAATEEDIAVDLSFAKPSDSLPVNDLSFAKPSERQREMWAVLGLEGDEVPIQPEGLASILGGEDSSHPQKKPSTKSKGNVPTLVQRRPAAPPAAKSVSTLPVINDAAFAKKRKLTLREEAEAEEARLAELRRERLLEDSLPLAKTMSLLQQQAQRLAATERKKSEMEEDRKKKDLEHARSMGGFQMPDFF